jgi:hypothetical protein
MTNFLFWAIWTVVASFGFRYSFNELLNKDITLYTSIITILVYQWIRLIKPPDTKNKETLKEVKNNKVTLKLPNSNNRRNR